jgi:hypothetical protein
VDFKSTAIEIDANFRANQPGRACNECFFHGSFNLFDEISSYSPVGFFAILATPVRPVPRTAREYGADEFRSYRWLRSC